MGWYYCCCVDSNGFQMAIETGALPVRLDLPGMTPEDLAALRRAVLSLEHPGLAARLTVRQDRRTNRLKVGVMDIAPIKTQRDYRNALKEIEGLMTAKRNTPEGDRLDVLVTLVEAWERKHYRIRSSGPGGGDQVSYGPEWASTARPHSLHRQPQPGARGAQSQALAHAQNDLATA